jgi:hypothetical protein
VDQLASYSLLFVNWDKTNYIIHLLSLKRNKFYSACQRSRVLFHQNPRTVTEYVMGSKGARGRGGGALIKKLFSGVAELLPLCRLASLTGSATVQGPYMPLSITVTLLPSY